MVDPSDVPQTSDLHRVRRAVATMERGRTAPTEIARSLRVSARHAAYARGAARILGWVDPRGRVTPVGHQLLATDPGTADELAVMRKSVVATRVVRELVPELIDPLAAPTLDAITARLERAGLATATARRRASTLLAWRRALNAAHFALPGVPPQELDEELRRNLERDNPWWHGRAAPLVPPFERDMVASIRRRLETRLAPIVVVRGPRQVGKTIAQQQLIESLLAQGVPPRNILRVQFDDLPSMRAWQEPILRIVEWYERAVLDSTLNDLARRDEQTFLFFDEVQNLKDWAIQLKHLVDSTTTQVVVTGSSALRIEQGRDSLAGRITTLEVGTLTLSEIARIRGDSSLLPIRPENGIDPLGDQDFWLALRGHGLANRAARDRAFAFFSERGGYPRAHQRADVPWPELADQLNEFVVKRVIQHDLRLGDRGRKRDPALLEEIFRLACRYAGQSPDTQLFVREIQRALHGNVGPQRVRHYLDFLDRALLVRQVRPLELRLKRTRGAAKLCLADHGLRAAWLQEVIPLVPAELDAQPHLADLAGRIAESVVGALLCSIANLDVAHFPQRSGEPEIDFIVTVGTRRIPIEVKYRRRIEPLADTEGLRTFVEKSHYNAPFGVLVTQTDQATVTDPRIVELPLASLLLLR